MKCIRPIDANGLMNLLEMELDMNGITDWGKGYMDAIHDAMEHVKFMPTLEVEGIKHGEWLSVNTNLIEGYYCSICGNEIYRSDCLQQDIKTKYCSGCGARMDK